MRLPTTQRVLRGGVTFGIAAILQRAAPLLLPVFAQILSPTEFGQISVIITVSAALTALLSFGLETAVPAATGSPSMTRGLAERS